MHDLHQDELDYYYPEDYYYENTYSDVWENCVLLSIYSILPTIFRLIGVNLCFGLITQCQVLPEWLFHVLSACSGLYILNSLESTEAIILVIIFKVLSFPLLKIVQYLELNKNVVKVGYISILVVCEYFLIDQYIWSQIRGILMVFTMKLISLMENSLNILEYLGYTFAGSNVLFGPWIGYQDYRKLYLTPAKKSFIWIIAIIRTLLWAFFYLSISNCWTDYFVSENSNRWIEGYKEALSVRTSHYFVSYLSELSMLSAGYKSPKIWTDPKKWSYTTVKPLLIEFPTALAVVVSNWNIPMHEFLKKHIYKPCLPQGKFFAILATFLVSSFLHGFALHVSVVLILLGLFSYIQIEIRDYLSKAFNMCIKIHPCKECHHKIPRNNFKSKIMLVIFSLFTMLHLVYVGIILDESTLIIGIWGKWSNLYYISFWIMLFNLAVIKL